MNSNFGPFKEIIERLPVGVLIIIISMPLLASCAQEVTNESQEMRYAEAQYQYVVGVIKNESLRQSAIRLEYGEFCAKALGTLLDRKVTRTVSPTFMTRDAFDVGLGRYRACEEFADWPPRVQNSDSQFTGPRSVGDDFFAIYEIYDGETRTEILYAEPSAERMALNERSGYWTVNLNSCTKKPIALAGRDGLLRPQGASMVVNIAGQNLVVDAVEYQPNAGMERLYEVQIYRVLRDQEEGYAPLICSWQAAK